SARKEFAPAGRLPFILAGTRLAISRPLAIWGVPMRVLINVQAALGQRTGIGHHLAELLRCLRRLPGLLVRPFPRPHEALMHDWYEGQSRSYQATAARADLLSRTRTVVHGKFLALARKAGVCAFGDHFRRLTAGERLDLYHEPNFMPLETDLPTVTTVHDL